MTETEAETADTPEAQPLEGQTESPAPNATSTGEDGTGDPPLSPEGRERPRFLLDFPDDPELARLSRAFEAGNYQAVRRGATSLIESTSDPIVRAAAQELRRRIDPDPLMKYLLVVALGLFVFVVWYTYQGQPH